MQIGDYVWVRGYGSLSTDPLLPGKILQLYSATNGRENFQVKILTMSDDERDTQLHSNWSMKKMTMNEQMIWMLEN